MGLVMPMIDNTNPKGCHNCKWQHENPEFEALGCSYCVRGGMVTADHPNASDNWTPKEER